MKTLFFLLWLVLLAVPLRAQIMPPSPQFINAVSSGVTVCTSGNCATWTVPNTNPSLTMQITGTMTSMTLTFEATADGQTWFTVSATKLSDGTSTTTTTSTGQFAITNLGILGFRARCTTYVSGGANVSLTRGSASAKGGSGGGGGAPADATFITETANATLTNEFALGSLASGLLFNATTTGVPSIYAGSLTCSASSVASLNASGVATCATAPSFSSSVGFGSLVSPYGITTLTSPQTEDSNSFQLRVTRIPPKVDGQAATGAGSCTAGTHVATVTAVGTGGTESLPYPSTPAVTCVGSDAVRVNVGSPQIGVASLNMYISKAGTTTPLFRCLTGSGIGSTQLSCTLADGSLGAQNPPSTQPLPTRVLEWHQSDERAADAFSVGPTGLQLFPGETSTSNDYTLGAWAAVPGTLFLTNTTNGQSRSFQAGNLYLGSTMAAQGDRYHLTQSEFAATTANIHLWCSSVVNSTCDTGLKRNAAGTIEINTGSAAAFGDVKVRHVLGGGTAPVVTNTSAASCGSTAATLVGSDIAGKVTVGGTAGTSCTVTFTTAYANPPACFANNETTANLSRATSTVSAVVLAGTFVAGDVISYGCLSY